MKFYRLEDGSGRYLGMDSDVPEHITDAIPELISAGLIDTSHEKTYSEKEFKLVTSPPTPTWENTLTCHGERSSQERLMELANDLGYTYFAWNERLYKVTNFTCEGLAYSLVEDIYTIDIK